MPSFEHVNRNSSRNGREVRRGCASLVIARGSRARVLWTLKQFGRLRCSYRNVKKKKKKRKRKRKKRKEKGKRKEARISPIRNRSILGRDFNVTKLLVTRITVLGRCIIPSITPSCLLNKAFARSIFKHNDIIIIIIKNIWKNSKKKNLKSLSNFA